MDLMQSLKKKKNKKNMKIFYQKFKPVFNLIDCFLFGYLFSRFGLEISIVVSIMMLNHMIKSLSEIDFIMISELVKLEEAKENVRNKRAV